MADIKESAMTQKSDCKWVRALDSNGNSIRISKEDLASVVGGLIATEDFAKKIGSFLPLGFNYIHTTKGTYKVESTAADRSFTFFIWASNGGQGGFFIVTLSAIANTRTFRCLAGYNYHLEVYYKIGDDGLYDFWIKGKEATGLLIYVLRHSGTLEFIADSVPSDAVLIPVS